MEGLLHPVGPEEARVYWIRRGAAVFAAVFLLVTVGSIVGNIGGAERSVAAEPAPPVTNVAVEPTAMEAPTSAPADPSHSQPVADEEAVPVPSGAETKERMNDKPGEASAPKDGEAVEVPPTPAAELGSSASPTPTKAEPLPPEPANTFHRTEEAVRAGDEQRACEPQVVRLSLDGPERVQKGVPVMYRVGVTNTSDRECFVKIDEKALELKVYSGSDRIWSSWDCVTGTPTREASLPPGGNMAWEMEWRVERSASQCRANGEHMGPGTYVATAQLEGTKAARLVMQLQV